MLDKHKLIGRWHRAGPGGFLSVTVEERDYLHWWDRRRSEMTVTTTFEVDHDVSCWRNSVEDRLKNLETTRVNHEIRIERLEHRQRPVGTVTPLEYMPVEPSDPGPPDTKKPDRCPTCGTVLKDHQDSSVDGMWCGACMRTIWPSEGTTYTSKPHLPGVDAVDIRGDLPTALGAYGMERTVVGEKE